jgi:hypothetical protein
MRFGLYRSPASRRLKKPLGGGGVPAALHQDVEHDAVLVHRTPEVVQHAVDAQIHLIEVPGVARPRPPPAELAGEVGPEPEAPLPDALVGDADAPLGQDQLHVAQAQAEDVVEPYCMADDLGREAVAGVGGGLGRHPASIAQPARSGQKPSTWQCLAGGSRRSLARHPRQGVQRHPLGSGTAQPPGAACQGCAAIQASSPPIPSRAPSAARA